MKDTNFWETTWNRAFRLRIDKEDQLIEGSLTKRKDSSIYTTASRFDRNHAHQWQHEEALFNLISTARWVHKGKEVNLETDSARVYGDMMSTQGVFPYKSSGVYLEFSFLNERFELVTVIVTDEYANDNDIARDKVMVENEWTLLDPVEFIYDDNKKISKCVTFNTDNKTTELNVSIEYLQHKGNAIDVGLIAVDVSTATVKATGYYVDTKGEKHEFVGAYGFNINQYTQL